MNFTLAFFVKRKLLFANHTFMYDWKCTICSCQIYCINFKQTYKWEIKFKNSHRVMMDTKINMFYMDRIKHKSSFINIFMTCFLSKQENKNTNLTLTWNILELSHLRLCWHSNLCAFNDRLKIRNLLVTACYCQENSGVFLLTSANKISVDFYFFYFSVRKNKKLILILPYLIEFHPQLRGKLICKIRVIVIETGKRNSVVVANL